MYINHIMRPGAYRCFDYKRGYNQNIDKPLACHMVWLRKTAKVIAVQAT